jgi:anti-sigma factor RsiW
VSADERDCGADAAAYVLGGLEPAEAAAFRQHMSTCAICQDEVAAFGQVADALHLVAPQLRTPRSLRRRVMRAVRAEPKPAARSPGDRAGLQLGPRVRRAAPALGVALTLAAVLVLGAVALLSGANPGPKLIHASVIGSPGSAEVRVAGGHAELIVRGFPPPPSGHVYEVWLKRPGRAPAPTRTLFTVTSNGAGDVGVVGDLHGVRQVLVTPEPDGGSLVPTHAPVIVAQLT